MKKSKKISSLSFFVAIILMCIVGTAAIILLLDQQNTEIYENLDKTTQSGYSQLLQQINALKSKVDSFNKNVDKMAGVDIDASDFETASKNLEAKLDKLDQIEKDFIDSFKNESKGLDYTSYFNYNVNKEPVINTFAKLKDQAELDLRRAVSVKAQDDILTKYKKDLDAVQTNIELLNATLAKIDKGGVTLDDLSDYVLSVSLHAIINPAIYAFDAANDIKEQLEIETKLEELHESLMNVALDGFVAQVKALPETQLISLKNEAAVIAARDTHKILTDSKYGFYTVDELAKLENEAFHKAEKTLDLAEKHVDVLNQMNGKLDEDTKKPIEGNNALWINAQIKSYEKTNIGANPTTKLWLDKLVALVEAWDNTIWTDATGKYDFELVTDKNDKENYSADIYNMIDRATLKKYLDKFDAEVAKLEEPIDDVIYYANRLDPVDLKSQETIDFIEEKIKVLNKATGNLKYDEIDFVVGFEADKGVNAAFNMFKQYKEDYAKLMADLKAHTGEIEAAIKKICADCTVNHGKNPCNCKPTVDTNKLAKLDVEKIDALILELIVKFGADEDYINADLLAIYKSERIKKLGRAAETNFDTAYASISASERLMTKEQFRDVLAVIYAIEYSFGTKLEGTDYVLVEVCREITPSARMAEFTVEYLAKLIVSQPEK